MTILGSWTCLVISLSQAGKKTMFESVMDAVKGVGNANLGQMEGREGMGVFSSMVGGESITGAFASRGLGCVTDTLSYSDLIIHVHSGLTWNDTSTFTRSKETGLEHLNVVW